MATKPKRGEEPVYISFHNNDRSAAYTAERNLNTAKLPEGFLAVPDPKGEKPGSVKLHWDKLNSTAKGVRTPLQNKGWITRRFNELAAQGWSVKKK